MFLQCTKHQAMNTSGESTITTHNPTLGTKGVCGQLRPAGHLSLAEQLLSKEAFFYLCKLLSGSSNYYCV